MFKNIVNYLSYVPKYFVTAVAALALVMAPLQISAQEVVDIESVTRAANLTAGEKDFKDSTNAKIGDELEIQVWYHNKEDADSGLIAENLNVKIDVPSQPGKTQTITGTVSSDNSNTVVDGANINLNTDGAYLEYIPGSATWRHNAGTNEDPNFVEEFISDDVVTSGTGLVLEDAQPCFNFEASVFIRVKVKQAISIEKQVRHVGDSEWQKEVTAKVGDKVEYLLTVKNVSNVTLNNVALGDNLPGPMKYIEDTTMIKNGNHPDGLQLQSNNITTGGVNIGHYNPGALAFVWFQAEVTNRNLECGANALKNVGVVSSDEFSDDFINDAIVNVKKVCEEQPEQPEQPEAPAEELPVTGPAETAAGLMASGGLGYAIRAYARSKKDLLSALLNK